jgi:RNA polymerase sigma-70 factor (ECF subfamily)
MNGKPGRSESERLDKIGTDWEIVYDPGRFVMRYGTAVERYFRAIIKNVHDAEELSQEFFLFVAKNGFVRVRKEGGRFRDYLRTAARNAALNFLQRKRRPKATHSDAAMRMASAKPAADPEQEWTAEWRKVLIERAMQGLRQVEGQSSANLSHTVLQMLVDHPLDDTTTLAKLTTAQIGRPVEPAAFRQQVSRARRRLAQLLIDEVAQTLDQPTPANVQEELMEFRLWECINAYLPEDWHTWLASYQTK